MAFINGWLNWLLLSLNFGGFLEAPIRDDLWCSCVNKISQPHFTKHSNHLFLVIQAMHFGAESIFSQVSMQSVGTRPMALSLYHSRFGMHAS